MFVDARTDWHAARILSRELQDVWHNARDTMALCALCTRATSLAFMFVNDDDYAHSWDHLVRDNACKSANMCAACTFLDASF